MNQTARLTAVLGSTCLLAGVILAAGNLVTLAPRTQAGIRERHRHLRLVLPEFHNDPTGESLNVPVRTPDGREADAVTFYLARDAERDGRLVGLAAETTSRKGYGGDLTVLAGMAPDGTLLQIMVTRHSETPGLGTRVTDRVRVRYLWQAFSPVTETGLPPSAYLDQYRERAAADVASPDFRLAKSAAERGPKMVQAVSGATVSSAAVADAVKLIGAAFAEHRAEFPVP